MPFHSKIIMMAAVLLLGSIWLQATVETIYDIRVVGNQNVESSLVLSALNLRTGDSLDPEEVAKSIKSLNNLSLFRTVEIETEPYRTGVNLIIKVSEYPIVDDIRFAGFKVIKKEKLDELTTLRKGSYWSAQLENQITRALTKEYVSKGYNNASVSYQVTPKENNRIELKVISEEGKRVAIRSIVFTGNEQIEAKQLLKRMKTKTASLFRSGRFEQDNFDKDQKSLIDYYRKNGYIDARIIDWQLTSLDEKSLKLVINLEEGSKYNFGTITVSGNSSFSSEAILSKFTLKSGKPFDQEKFDEQMRKVYSLYFEEGYIYVNIEPDQIKAGDLLNINLQVTEKTRAKVRQIQIAGNRRTKEKVLRRQLAIAPGDYFRQSQVILSQQNIYNLGFIDSDMKLDYTTINNGGDIDLNLSVTDKSAGTANGGVGYNSQDGFVGQLSVSQNNLFGNNWTSSLKWEFGGSTQNFEFDFTNPNVYDTDILMGTSLYHTQKKWTSFYYEIFTSGASIRTGQPFPLVNRTQALVGYSLYRKKYRITDMASILANASSNQNLLELDSLGWRYTSIASLTLSRDTRDNIFFPTSGSQMILHSEIAGGMLGGNFDFYKQIAQISWFIDTWHRFALRTKWRFGYIAPYGRSKDAPPDEKFYLGGTGSDGIRGYPDRSIGPSGGGSREILFSTELGYPLGGDQIIALGFFDAGNSYNTLRDFNFLTLKKGVGTGIRIRSPLGLIGFDYAYNLEDRTWEPHLQFGTTF